jgi:hypothetical protein
MGLYIAQDVQTVIAGLVPAIPIHPLRDLRIEITPLRIALSDQARLPRPGPVLDVLLALYGLMD